MFFSSYGIDHFNRLMGFDYFMMIKNIDTSPVNIMAESGNVLCLPPTCKLLRPDGTSCMYLYVYAVIKLDLWLICSGKKN